MAQPHDKKKNSINLKPGNTQNKIFVMEYSKTEELLNNMINNPDLLRQGYKAFTNFEKYRNFYINLLKVVFEIKHHDKVKKLAASSLKTFLNKNWSDDDYITVDEKKV